MLTLLAAPICLLIFLSNAASLHLPRQVQSILQVAEGAVDIASELESSANHRDETQAWAFHPHFKDYRLRITEPTLCDESVEQYSGYLDISETKHLFFWFFEARDSPEDAPLMLWLNGGPGASTMASGLLFENGPCSVSPSGNSTIRNLYSWNSKANIIYLDQPVGTGYSYATDDVLVDTLDSLQVDVYAFLQIFMRRFPKYASSPFHVATESWGGHYGPHIAHHIFTKNKELIYAPFPGQLKINLASLVLANGLTEPASQFESIPEYLCGEAPYPPHDHDGPTCVALRLQNPSCVRAIKTCYRLPSNATCYAATMYCWPTQMSTPILSAKKNPYDLRLDCDVAQNPLCYPEFERIAKWLNNTETKIALGVKPDHNFRMVNNTVNEAFYSKGQAMLNSAALLPELVDHGVRLMAYAGNTDALCNYMGVELWMTRLEHSFHKEFESALSLPWLLGSDYHVGMVRSAGYGAGNVTFVQIFDAGHMAPHDQPEAALDMITRWLDNVPLGKTGPM